MNNPMKNYFSIYEIKNIIYSIFKEESNNYNVNVNLYVFTIVEYYRSNVFRKKLKLSSDPYKKIFNLIKPLRIPGLCNYQKGEIIIFLDFFRKKITLHKQHQLVDILMISYHEFYHLLQNSFTSDNFSFETFVITMENFIKDNDLNFYLCNHDNFYSEIQSNLFATKKSIDYLNKIDHSVEENISYANQLQEKYFRDYKNYNFQMFFNKFCELYKNNPNKIVYYGTIIEIFFNKNGDFKNISEIMHNPSLPFVDHKLVLSILSSKIFLNQLNWKELTADEKYFLMNLGKTSQYNNIKFR